MPGFLFMEIKMSDDHTVSPAEHELADLSPEWAEISEKDRIYKSRADELLSINKNALFVLLAAADITLVEVSFDGCGDSGQIEEIQARTGEGSVELPEAQVEILDPIWGSSETRVHTLTIHDAIEAMAYALLRQTHDGWEDGDGAHGDFTFDVAAQTITLDYNERYTSSNNYTHEF